MMRKNPSKGGQISVPRWALCALLLVLVAAPLSVGGVQTHVYGGWPALGFAIALFVVAGPGRAVQVVAVEALVISVTVLVRYDLSLWTGVLGTLSIVVPAWYAQHTLTTVATGHLRLDEVDSDRYHLVTAVTAVLSGAITFAATTTRQDVETAVVIGVLSFLAALTGQLAVLPLLIRGSSRPPAGTAVELMVQRLMLLLTVALVFGPTSRLYVAFLVFPMLGWAANRATRRECHWQLFLVCLTAYGLTLLGRGPFAGSLAGIPESLRPALLYLFLAAACYMAVPLTMTVERLVVMTSQATRAATTVERLLDSVSGAMIIATDADMRITHFNTGAQDTLGYTLDEVLGQRRSIFHTVGETERQAAHFGVRPDYVSTALEMVRLGERRDWEFTRKDGQPRMASLTLSEVTDGDGAVVGYIGAGDDITERLRAEEALVTALDREHASVLRLREVDEVKQELVSNVSHELRTPITSIAGYAELLSDSSLGSLTDGQADAVDRIVRNTNRLRRLVEDMLTLSTAEAGTLKMEQLEIDLRTVAAESLEMMTELLRGRVLGVKVIVPDEPVLVIGDNHALERVVLNLLGNAIKFTPDDGCITLSVARTAHGAAVTVKDTGMGISAEDQQHLFTRFFRTSASTEHAIQGTGLGLSIVHAIVDRHGGSVSIDSARGCGTSVTVVLPSA
jgi:PAS domain S-box-containing protein